MTSALSRALLKFLAREWKSARFFAPRTFSQTGEDAILRTWLPESKGFYVDVGAGLPIWGSNTFSFYRSGWTGFLFEPIARNARLLQAVRPRDRVIKALVSSFIGTSEFYQFRTYEFSTMNSEIARRLTERGTILREKTLIPVTRLEAFGLKATPEDPSFLSIDVEGEELGVLQGNDWTEFLPRCICVEQWGFPRNRDDIAQFLTEKGYMLCAYTGLSAIYVHRTWILTKQKKDEVVFHGI